MARRIPPLATSSAQAEDNIRRYRRELDNSRGLRDRVTYARAWYAYRNADDEWLFAPSKFVGYVYSSARDYLADTGREGLRDGRQTETVLEEWFELVDPDSRLGRELFEALRAFLGRIGKKPNARARINILKRGSDFGVVDRALLRPSRDDHLLSRVTTDPRVCGGRPCIRGTRMRVTDIIDMLAHGATRAEILQDFDYLSDEDVTAALYYAARVSDHRVIQTA